MHLRLSWVFEIRHSNKNMPIKRDTSEFSNILGFSLQTVFSSFVNNSFVVKLKFSLREYKTDLVNGIKKCAK